MLHHRFSTCGARNFLTHLLSTFWKFFAKIANCGVIFKMRERKKNQEWMCERKKLIKLGVPEEVYTNLSCIHLVVISKCRMKDSPEKYSILIQTHLFSRIKNTNCWSYYQFRGTEYEKLLNLLITTHLRALSEFWIQNSMFRYRISYFFTF